MGLFRKGDKDHSTAGSSVKRYFKKFVAFLLASTIFGVMFTSMTTRLIDQAITGEIGIGKALELAVINSLQYGTLKAPVLINTMFQKFSQGLIFTGIVRFGFPLIILFYAGFQIVSIIVDLADMRPDDAVTWKGKAFLTIGLFLIAWMSYTGFAFFGQAELTFPSKGLANMTINESRQAVNNMTGTMAEKAVEKGSEVMTS